MIIEYLGLILITITATAAAIGAVEVTWSIAAIVIAHILGQAAVHMTASLPE